MDCVVWLAFYNGLGPWVDTLPATHVCSIFSTPALIHIGGERDGQTNKSNYVGPTYGLVAYGLNWVGFGPAVEETPGPWNERPMALIPGLVTHTVYGTVTDLTFELVEDMLN